MSPSSLTGSAGGAHAPSAEPAALALEGLTKAFAGVTVLDGVSLTISPGEIHGLVGQNGSGKSTIVKVLAGYHSPDAGHASLWGEAADFPLHAGIAVIHQDLALTGSMSVIENFGIQSRYGAGRASAINWAEENRILERWEGVLDAKIPRRAHVSELDPVDRALLAIMRALRLADESSARTPILVLDEPTVYLTDRERDRLFAIVRRIADDGGAVLLVSHRLREVVGICDRVSVLRNGEIVACVDSTDTNIHELANLMVGKEIDGFYPPKAASPSSDVVLSAEGLSGDVLKGIDFELHRGEILGMTGIAGMGQDEAPYALVGAVRGRSSAGGVVTLGGVRFRRRSPVRMRRAGLALALVPANRAQDSVWGEGTALENLTIAELDEHEGRWWIGRRRDRARLQQIIARYHVEPPRLDLQIRAFSGGNQQKIVLARWMAGSRPRVLLLHEPTQGVDVGARRQILELLAEAAEAGTSVIVCSSDHEEVAAICHRVLVLEGGAIKGALAGDDVTEASIVRLAQV
jgi:ribose transport system ATP-binding protein